MHLMGRLQAGYMHLINGRLWAPFGSFMGGSQAPYKWIPGGLLVSYRWVTGGSQAPQK